MLSHPLIINSLTTSLLPTYIYIHQILSHPHFISLLILHYISSLFFSLLSHQSNLPFFSNYIGKLLYFPFKKTPFFYQKEMAILFKRNNSYGYTMMEKEDPQDKHHREAQFLIYKTLKQVDQVTLKKSSRPSWLKLRICKLKIRIGKKLLKLRKTILSNMVKTKMDVYKHVIGHLKSFKRLFHVGGRHGGGAISIGRLPQPLFT